MMWTSETSKPMPSNTFPPTRPRLLILPKQFYHGDYLNIWANGNTLIQAITHLFPPGLRRKPGFYPSLAFSQVCNRNKRHHLAAEPRCLRLGSGSVSCTTLKDLLLGFGGDNGSRYTRACFLPLSCKMEAACCLAWSRIPSRQ